MENHGTNALFWRRSIDHAVTVLSGAGIVVGAVILVSLLVVGPSLPLLYGGAALAAMSLLLLAASTTRYLWIRGRD